MTTISLNFQRRHHQTVEDDLLDRQYFLSMISIIQNMHIHTYKYERLCVCIVCMKSIYMAIDILLSTYIVQAMQVAQ
jgi:hypothetical protein